MRTFLLCAILALSAASARTLEVGAGKQYTRLQAAATVATPGDTILMRAGTYSGGDAIANLQGTAAAWITLRAANSETVLFRGGSQAFQLSDAAFLRIEDLTFEQQTGNGVNIDDGGTLDTPSHHIVIERCVWLGMNATGNNDELKMSGIDTFTVRNCIFLNGSAGGSQIDMVGCHQGIFAGNYFEDGGSNCIQAKGGSSDILIQGNTFINGGERALNIGGSTGLAFFRPQGINYEAANIYVYSNIFVGSTAPIAFVGAVNCEVINNTIHRPTRWAIRILQETVGNGFLPCSNNSFINNIIVFSTGQPAINISGNTSPETFTFSHNLWFNPDNPTWNGPNTPVTEVSRILNMNPQFDDTTKFFLATTSPARGKGKDVPRPEADFSGMTFTSPRSIGARHGNPPMSVQEGQLPVIPVQVRPHPVTGGCARLLLPAELHAISTAQFINIATGSAYEATAHSNGMEVEYDVHALPEGVYIVELQGQPIAKVMIMR